jgi:hypothetical protein
MTRLYQLTLVAALVTWAPGRTADDVAAPAPAAEYRDPDRVFRKACEGLVALEPKHDLLKGVSEVKPVVERDDKGRPKSASLVFERNAAPAGKGSAQPKDESMPFIYVSIQLWSGRTQSPPGDLHEFEWNGRTYQMWVKVLCSDAELVKVIRKAIDLKQLEPPQLTFRLETSQPLQEYRKGQPLVFEGIAVDPIHRPGPEHFKVTRVSDTQVVPMHLDYDREQVEKRRPDQVRGTRAQKGELLYNSLFKGTRLFLYNGTFGAKDPMGQAGILDLYGCPELEAGVLYRVTWACWPVGAKEAVEVTCEFKLGK